MTSSAMLRLVALVTTDVSEERMSYIIRVLRLLVKANVFPSSPISVILMTEAVSSSETSVHTRFTLCNIPLEGTLDEWCLRLNCRATATGRLFLQFIMTSNT
jgi:hypothetical protein